MRLDQILNRRHPLYQLADTIEWESFDEAFGKYYSETQGRPAKSTRLMVGLHYLKHTFDLSDEEVVSQWVENPYWQYFCGLDYFEHEFPIDPSLMTKWRARIKSEGLEKLLGETIKAGLRSKVIRESSFERINVDTTVQEKAITFPTDAKLYHRMREKLVGLAIQEDLKLRQTYRRKSKKSLMMQGRYSHARQMKRAQKEIRSLKVYLGRVVRDIERKIKGHSNLESLFSEPLNLARRILSQQRHDSPKIYSIHAPEVECISKGKAHKKYEFGCKVSVATTSRDNFVIGVKAFHGNPYDGHTLHESVLQAERLAGFTANEIFVDRGYRGHDYEGDGIVHVAKKGMKRLSASLRRWFKRRSAIEPIIGHMKNDGRLRRNYLLGEDGDQINALLCGAGQNLRKLLVAFLFFLFYKLFQMRFLAKDSV